jgi:HEAT repeat protein
MSISVNCPTCGKAYTLNESFVGKKVRCKHCAETFPVELEAVLPANAPAANDKPDTGTPNPPATDRPAAAAGALQLQSEAGATSAAQGERDNPDKIPEVLKAEPGEEKKPQKKGFPVWLGVLAGVALVLFLGCAAAGTVVVLVIVKVRNTVDEVADNLKKNVPPPPPPRSLTVADSVADLRSGEEARKQQAAEWLEKAPFNQVDQPKVAKALEPLLLDVNSDVKHRAAVALINWGGPENVPALIRCVEADDPSTIEPAVKALAKIGDNRAIAPIAKLLANGNRRNLAANALQSFGAASENEVVKVAFHPDQGAREEAQRLLRSWKTKEEVLVVQAIVDLKTNDVNRQTAAALWLSQVHALPKSLDEVSVALNPVLREANEAARNSAIKAVQVWATKANVPTLIDMLNDQNLQHPFARESRGIVIRTLASLKDERAAAAFARELATREWRHQASAALEELGAAAEPEVLKYFNHPDAQTRKHAADILTKIGTKPEALVTQCLADLKGGDFDQRVLAALWLSQTTVIEKQRDAVSAALNPLLKDPNEATRNSAIKALKVWATKANVPTLVEMLNDPAWRHPFLRELRSTLFAALADLKDERAAGVFCNELNTDLATKAVAALEALGPVAEPEVLKYLHHPDANVRKRAADLLKKYGTKDEVIFAQALTDLKSKEMASRQGAAQTLADLPPIEAKRAEASTALEPLFLEKDRNVLVAALKAAKVWGTKENVPTLLKIATEKGPGQPKEVTAAVLETLAVLKDERAYWPIAQLCSYIFRQEEAKKCLAQIGAAAEPEVAKHLSDENPKERKEAWTALGIVGIKKNLMAYEAIAKNEKDFQAKRAAEMALKAIAERD